MNTLVPKSPYPALESVIGVIRSNRYSTNSASWQQDIDREYGKDKVKFFVAKAPIFTMLEYPGKIFKMKKDLGEFYENSPCQCPKTPKTFNFDSQTARKTNASFAHIIIKQYLQTKIKCPSVELVKVGYSDRIAVEEILEFDTDMKTQEQRFNSDDPDLDETIKQFAKLILLTGYADVKVENNPLSEDNSVNLVDFEHCYRPCSESTTCIRPLLGILGGGNVSTNKGLMGLVSKRHTELVVQVCREHFGNHWSQEWENRAQIKLKSRNEQV